MFTFNFCFFIKKNNKKKHEIVKNLKSVATHLSNRMHIEIYLCRVYDPTHSASSASYHPHEPAMRYTRQRIRDSAEAKYQNAGCKNNESCLPRSPPPFRNANLPCVFYGSPYTLCVNLVPINNFFVSSFFFLKNKLKIHY